MTKFKDLNLHPSILESLNLKGYTTPTPIQEKAIPELLKGEDLLGIAQTGTGKTAAFSLPLLNNFSKNKKKVRPYFIRSLILTPTRELASQIELNIKEYGKNLSLSSAVIFGGVGKPAQIIKLSRGVDILIATPGRLLDLMSEDYIKINELEVLILDEADRMLDMGFIHDIKKIIKIIPKKRQTLLFSATMPQEIEKLANSLLKNAKKVEVTPQNTTVEKINQKICKLEREFKNSLLQSIFEDKSIESALVFSRTKHGADRIVKVLEKAGVPSMSIHGNKSQNARERALSSFKSGELRVLVATDIAARGIDIPSVSHIINFNLPEDPENYVHRIGRTARAGRSGYAISFCDESEEKLLKSIEKFINQKIPIDTTHPFQGLPVSIKKAKADTKSSKNSSKRRRR